MTEHDLIRAVLAGHPCTGDRRCLADRHIHGCYADFGYCDSPEEHGQSAVPADRCES